MLPIATTVLDFFVHLIQGVYLPWCTSIQSLPSLCHVLFASQKKVRSHTSMYTSKDNCRWLYLSFVNWLMSLMFQTWLENSRKCRMHQTPAQWPSSSNKEQVGHKTAFALYFPQQLSHDASVAVLTFPQQRLLEHHIFLECWSVRQYVCLLIRICSSLS